jgi:hypothetical protein
MIKITPYIIIILASFLQPYLVLGWMFGRSNACWNCLIIEQTFFDTIYYLILPMWAIYFVMNSLKINYRITALSISLYFAVVSLIKITIPLFNDRVAAWSTFTQKEMLQTAIYSASPFLIVLSAILFFTLSIVIKK